MNVTVIRQAAAELQSELDKSRALAAKTPALTAPVLLSDDRVAAYVNALSTLADEAELHQVAFRKIYWRASQANATAIAALALQYADLSAAPTPI